jgi:hypothetical protein
MADDAPKLPPNPTLADVRRYVSEMRAEIARMQAEVDRKEAGLRAIEGAAAEQPEDPIELPPVDEIVAEFVAKELPFLLETRPPARRAFPGPLHDAPPSSEKGRLPLREQYDTLDAMNTSEIDTRPGVPGRKFTTRHPLTAKAKALKIPIKDVAEQLSKKLKRTIPRTTDRSWYAPKDSGDGRPIPEDAVKFFEADPWDIPRSAWKNGISEP